MFSASQRAAARLRDSLLGVAQSYGSKPYIPYVWGGNAIGSVTSCEQCRACLRGHGHSAHRSARACSACQECGVDCSHFVHRMFADAGLIYPYLSTDKLRRMTPARLRAANLIDVGRDLRKAQPGDLLVQSHHVVLLLSLNSATHGDFIHANRPVKHGIVGGIEIKHDIDLRRDRVVRILRHMALEGAPSGLHETLLAAPRLDPMTDAPESRRLVRAE